MGKREKWKGCRSEEKKGKKENGVNGTFVTMTHLKEAQIALK